MKIAHHYVPTNGVSIDDHSAFYADIKNTVQTYGCKRIIETGTYCGLGTTSALLSGMSDDASLYTIEASKNNWKKAVNNTKDSGKKVHCLHGLSVPYAMLPTEKDIELLVEKHIDLDVFVDHEDSNRISLYYTETPVGLQDDLLRKAFSLHNNMPDLLLLDSAGHIGKIEFNYALSLLNTSCVFILDDTQHIKHHLSVEHMKKDFRFKIVKESTEKFGYVIAEYHHTAY